MIGDDEMQDSEYWADQAKRILRSEMVRCGATYADLAGRLEAADRPSSASSLRNKISRGRFSAAFFLKCLHALECERVRIR